MFPEIGIMSGGELEGNWRGIYPHKNVLGFAMAVAVFVQLQLIAMETKRSISSLCLGLFLFYFGCFVEINNSSYYVYFIHLCSDKLYCMDRGTGYMAITCY